MGQIPGTMIHAFVLRGGRRMGLRAELRRQKKAERKKKKTYNMTNEQREQEKARNVALGTDQAIILLLAIPLKVMHDKYGWRARKRLPEFCDAISEEYQRFVDGQYKDIFDYAEFVEQVTGGRFVREV